MLDNLLKKEGHSCISFEIHDAIISIVYVLHCMLTFTPRADLSWPNFGPNPKSGSIGFIKYGFGLNLNLYPFWGRPDPTRILTLRARPGRTRKSSLNSGSNQKIGSSLAALMLSAVDTPENLIKSKNLQNQYLALKWILCIENTRSAHKILLHYE
jgi:hypothetical protein